MNEVLFFRPNPESFIMTPGICSLDVTTRIRITNKSVGAPITGKKIVSTVQVPVALHEKSPPSEIYRKKSPPKEHSPPVIRHKLAKPSPKRKTCEKSAIQEKTFQKKPEKPSFLQLKTKKPHKKQVETISNEENSQKLRLPSKKLKKLLKSSLKKEKNRKTLEAIQEKKKIEKKEEKKLESNIRDCQIRHMNKRFKKVKLHHKYSWGVDQSRLKDPRDQSSEKPSSRKAISTERGVRTGLDTIKEMNLELGKSFIHFRKSSQTLEREEVHRPKHVSDPEVLRYMKNKNKMKKERQDFLNLQRFAENSKKFNEIHKIFQVFNKIKEKKKIKRKKQNFKRKNSEVQGNEEEIKESDLHKLELVYESSSLPGKEENKSSFAGILEETPPKAEVRQAVTGSDNLIFRAAVKIQSLIRSFLVRARLFNLHEFPSSDEQVREILSQKIQNLSDSERESCFSIPVTVPGKNLIIDLPSDNPSPISGSEFNIGRSSNSQNSSQSDLLLDLKAYKETKGHQVQILSFPEKPAKEQPNSNELLAQVNLKQQIILREAQLKTLESIKEKEMLDLQIISSRVGIDQDLNSILSKIVEKRYDQLSFLLEASFQGAEESFIERLGTEEREEFLNELEEKKEELTKRLELDQVESPVESFIQKKVFIEKEENRPVIYKPKVKIDLNETDQILETPQMSNIIHAQDLPENSNMFIEDLHISSESSPSEMGQLEIFSPGFDPGQVEEGSLEFSSSLNPYDTSLSGHFKYEVSDVSHTPEYIPERPSAPLHYFDRESPDTNPSPMLIICHLDETSSPQTPEMTPELVVGIAELLLMQLISEHPVFTKSLKIDTSHETIEKYCNQIFEKYSIEQLTKDLSSSPPGKNLELLKKLQNSEIFHFEVTEILAPANLVNLRVYINIENQLDSSRSQTSEVMTQKDFELLVDAQHIHNKAIFDAINEAFNKIRVMPTGISVPLGRNKSIFFYERPEKFMQDAKSLVLTWSSSEYGKTKSEDELEGLTEEEALLQAKEDKLVKMIYSEILENECKWTDYSLEEVQIKLELADLVLFVMAEEVIIILESN